MRHVYDAQRPLTAFFPYIILSYIAKYD